MFFDEFRTEEAFKAHFKAMRDKQGITTSKCGIEIQYCLQYKWMYQCAAYSYRFSLKRDTMIEHSKFEFKNWYAIMMQMIAAIKGFSTSGIQRQLAFF